MMLQTKALGTIQYGLRGEQNDEEKNSKKKTSAKAEEQHRLGNESSKSKHTIFLPCKH